MLAHTPLWISINALATQQFESNTLNNSKFGLGNGVILNSIIEGNLLNLAGNANVLYQSRNVSTFVVVPANFLPAYSANYIYWEFVGNTVTPSNNLWNTSDGAEFQVTNTIVGIGTATAKAEDSGANVFTIYYNLGSIAALPTNFSQTDTSGTVVQFGATNTAFATAIGGNFNSIFLSAANALNSFYSFNTLGNSLDIESVFQTSSFSFFGIGPASNTHFSGNAYYWLIFQGTPPFSWLSGSTSNTLTPNSVGGKLNIYTVSTQASTANVYVNYSLQNAIGASSVNPLQLIPMGATKNYFILSTEETGLIPIYIIRTRISPPNNLQPSTVFDHPSTILRTPTTPTLTLSNTLIDQGQSILFTASFSNRNSPYTYNFNIVNSITNAVISNQLYSGVTTYTQHLYF